MIDPAGGHEPVTLARLLLDAGASVLQLRLKEAGARDFLSAARAIVALAHEREACLIVNDRVDIAILAGADGVHLGQQDLPLEAARRLVGADRIIGISTHTVEQARVAEVGGADYIGFGAIYSGGLKNVQNAQGLERLREVRDAVQMPIVAIGGITEATIPAVLAAGADAAAIITDVVHAPNIAVKVKSILTILRAV
ncbi:MAG TPA: thiamine phosphate synthase [Candidatus Binataceae bacterium]|nr:thiamine phosphate synthase [Candidatus Binataceae bacterium]